MEEVRRYTREFSIRDVHDMTMISDEECAQKYAQKLVGRCLLGAYVVDIASIDRVSCRKYSNSSVDEEGRICVTFRATVQSFRPGMFVAGVPLPDSSTRNEFHIMTKNFKFLLKDEVLLQTFKPWSRIPVSLQNVYMEQASQDVHAYVELARPLSGDVEVYKLDPIEPEKMDELLKRAASVKHEKLSYAKVFDPKTKPSGVFIGDVSFLKNFKGGYVQFMLHSSGKVEVFDKLPKNETPLVGSSFAAFSCMLAQYVQYITFLKDMEKPENECKKLFDLF